MSECCCCSLGTWAALIFILAALVKIFFFFNTVMYNGTEKLNGKTAIVTGSNTSIGLVTAKDFAKRGARVIMVCRDMNKAEKAKNEIITDTGNNNIVLKHIDFLSLDSVRKCANEILSEESRIHILVNNAASGGIDFGPTEDGLEKLMQSNYFGPFLFTNILLGKLKESAPSRVVNVTSISYKIATINLNHMKKTNRSRQWRLYPDTKLANIYFSNELSHKMNGTGVTSNSLHPGIFISNLDRNYSGIILYFFQLAIKFISQSIEEGAQTSIYVAVSSEVAHITGEYFSNCKVEKLWDKARDMGLAKKLWELTEEAVQLKPSEKHY